MRVFRWLAVGCGAGVIAVGAFTGGVWVMRPQAVTVKTTPFPTPGRPVIPKSEPKQPDWSVSVIRPANHETPLPPVSLPAPTAVPAAPVVPLPTIPVPPKPTEPTTRYVNKPDLEFDYEVTKQGRSGVKAVTLFTSVLPTTPPGTPGFGFSFSTTVPIGGDVWAEAAKVEVGKPTERPKLAYTLEKEGRYGFRVGVSSGSVAAGAPKPTDEPEMVVVFDKTTPVIEQFTAEPRIVNGNPNGVIFQWKVNETHPSEKVALEYALNAERWQPITGFSQTSGMAWQIPNEAPAAVKVRLTVTDKAGNTAQKVIESVNLDHTVPHGRLTGVTAVEGKKAEVPDLPPIPKGDETK